MTDQMTDQMTDVRLAAPDEEQVRAAAELAVATRRLMLAAGTSDLGAEHLRAAAATMDDLSARLGVRSRQRVQRARFDGPADARRNGQPWDLFAYNPQAFPLAIHFSEDGARARVVANALYEGPHDSVHGGFLAHLLDCVIGTLMQARGQRALTATLDLRFLARTPLDEPLDLHSRIVSAAGRKTVAEGWIEHDGVRTVEATGLFVDIGTPPS